MAETGKEVGVYRLGACFLLGIQDGPDLYNSRRKSLSGNKIKNTNDLQLRRGPEPETIGWKANSGLDRFAFIPRLWSMVTEVQFITLLKISLAISEPISLVSELGFKIDSTREQLLWKNQRIFATYHIVFISHGKILWKLTIAPEYYVLAANVGNSFNVTCWIRKQSRALASVMAFRLQWLIETGQLGNNVYQGPNDERWSRKSHPYMQVCLCQTRGCLGRNKRSKEETSQRFWRYTEQRRTRMVRIKERMRDYIDAQWHCHVFCFSWIRTVWPRFMCARWGKQVVGFAATVSIRSHDNTPLLP